MNVTNAILEVESMDRLSPLSFMRKRAFILLACFIVIGSLNAISYVSYNTSNLTGFSSGFDNAKSVMQTATGNSDAFGLMIIATVFIGFYIIGSKYTQERALVYSSFMTVVIAFLLVSGNFLDPKWLILSIIALLAAIYFSTRVG